MPGVVRARASPSAGPRRGAGRRRRGRAGGRRGCRPRAAGTASAARAGRSRGGGCSYGAGRRRAARSAAPRRSRSRGRPRRAGRGRRSRPRRTPRNVSSSSRRCAIEVARGGGVDDARRSRPRPGCVSSSISGWPASGWLRMLARRYHDERCQNRLAAASASAWVASSRSSVAAHAGSDVRVAVDRVVGRDVGPVEGLASPARSPSTRSRAPRAGRP